MVNSTADIATVWDASGEHFYETGVDRGMLFKIGTSGAEKDKYINGVPWNGLTKVTDSPSGAEITDLYANNTKYLSMVSAETFGFTIEAFCSPKEFDECDGTAEGANGVSVGQQDRVPFGFSYRTILGNDTELNKHGYKIHLVYGCMAQPSSQDHSTVNESPEAGSLSWECKTTPVNVGGNFKPTSTIVIDATTVDPALLASFEEKLYGKKSSSDKPTMPLPAEVIAHFGGNVNGVAVTAG